MSREPIDEPTQKTRPKKGEPIDIPIPTEDRVARDFFKVASKSEYKVGMSKTTSPVLIERAGDLGWLATTPHDYPLRFAVAAPTEGEAKSKFAKSLAHWESIEVPGSLGASRAK